MSRADYINRRFYPLALHTIGVRSGNEHLIPLVTFEDQDRLVVVASKGGFLSFKVKLHCFSVRWKLYGHYDIFARFPLLEP